MRPIFFPPATTSLKNHEEEHEDVLRAQRSCSVHFDEFATCQVQVRQLNQLRAGLKARSQHARFHFAIEPLKYIVVFGTTITWTFLFFRYDGEIVGLKFKLNMKHRAPAFLDVDIRPVSQS